MSKLSIEDLVADLKPSRQVSPRDAYMGVGLAVGLLISVIAMEFGLRDDVMAGSPEPLVMIRGGTLLLLAFAALASVIASARPGVGQSSNGWMWALAAAALFPVTSIFASIIKGSMPMEELTATSGFACIAFSAAGALLVGGGLTVWLRQGAPTAIERTSWLVGLAAGSFGNFAYSLHCPSDTVHYVGIWYTLVVALCAVGGRLILPKLIRW
ncbi:MAG: NrsF family protein [Sphingomonadaceae bacterium]